MRQQSTPYYGSPSIVPFLSYWSVLQSAIIGNLFGWFVGGLIGALIGLLITHKATLGLQIIPPQFWRSGSAAWAQGN